jgi:hypothetical protein
MMIMMMMSDHDHHDRHGMNEKIIIITHERCGSTSVTNRTRSLGARVHAARDHHHEAAVDHRIIVVVVDILTSLQHRVRFLVRSKGNVWVHHDWSSHSNDHVFKIIFWCLAGRQNVDDEPFGALCMIPLRCSTATLCSWDIICCTK